MNIVRASWIALLAAIGINFAIADESIQQKLDKEQTVNGVADPDLEPPPPPPKD